MADLFNFVLKCAGCDHKVTNHDVEDPDHYAEKIGDIQDEYQGQGVTDYPLISKGKGAAAFKDSFMGFFTSLIHTMARSNLLFNHEAFMETLNAWVSTVTAANNRPFRHTATVASLAITSALCEIGKEIAEAAAKSVRQAEGEKKKGRVNKARVQELEAKAKEASTEVENVNQFISSWFDTVFIHRYRDVDSRIRSDCVQALGQWVVTFPDHFFDGTFLRYLGWVLSDTNKETRHEVLKALYTLYSDKEKLSGLRTFTERFRSRIVEMATNDSDPTVQADAVLLLDLLREAGFLEPDDIDAIGRLIFDAEPRLRKAVVGFFGENIKDNYDLKLEELGGDEALEEMIGQELDEDDFDSPRKEWLKFKCLAEILQSYDAYDELESAVVQRPGTDNYILLPDRLDQTRFSLASEALYDCVPELKDWEVLSGYLLYDHTQSTSGKRKGGKRNGASLNANQPFQDACKLDEKEEILLLEVLNTCVKQQLTRAIEASSDKKVKKTKAQKQVAHEEQEQAARHLALLIPRLLNKFGAVPDAASAVLRLEHVLNLEIFEELRQDLTAYSALLDDIKKQFLTHGRPQVLEEASLALLHASSFEDLEEVTAGKLQGLWEDTVNALHAVSKGRDLTSRGNLSDNVMSTLSNTVLRIGNLSRISDCTEFLEALPVVPRSKSQKAPEREPGIKSIISIIERGIPTADLDAETDAQEDEMVLQAARIATFYFMWKIRSFYELVSSAGRVPFNSLESVGETRDAYVESLTNVLRARRGADELRLSLAELMLDLFTSFDGLANIKGSPRARGSSQQQTEEDEEENDDVERDAHMALALEVPKKTQVLLLQILGATEKALAKRTKRNLEAGDEDDVEMDEEPESDDEDEDEAQDEAKLKQAVLADKRLCDFAGKLILGIWCGILDGQTEGVIDPATKIGVVEQRLRRNAKHLGPTYKSLIEQIDVGKPGAAPKKKRTAAAGKGSGKAGVAEATKATANATAKSAEIILESDEEDEEEDEIVDDEIEAEGDAAKAPEEEDMEAEDGAAKEGTVDEVESVLGD
jgi:cohesin complex subunit SA-1/2